MNPKEERTLRKDIINKRRLPYSLEILEVQGDKYKVLTNFGSEIVYIKKGDAYFLEEELK
ncbi:MAG: hypothetical protein KGD63_06185 [Candidatus Lokiarchaeota archaeon]|nr:hypothetical protein [Candidatus Lokiarchaeota archaeon]